MKVGCIPSKINLKHKNNKLRWLASDMNLNCFTPGVLSLMLVRLFPNQTIRKMVITYIPETNTISHLSGVYIQIRSPPMKFFLLSTSNGCHNVESSYFLICIPPPAAFLFCYKIPCLHQHSINSILLIFILLLLLF